MKIKNSVALVTGAASGMGRATAKMLAKNGARVALLDIHADAVAELAKEIDGHAIHCNVTDSLSLSNAYVELEEHWGIPGICINCAGIVAGSRVVGKTSPMPLEDFRHVIEVNLIGTFNVIRLAAFAMSRLEPVTDEEERGVIINTASIAAFEGQLGQAAYSASKGGVAAMTLPIARELASQKIRVNTIAPGLFDTPMMNSMSEKVKDSLINSTLFPKRLGKPEEYAKLVCHIIDNPMINGEVIRLDGGVRLNVK